MLLLALYLDNEGKIIKTECLNEDAKEIFADIKLKDLSVEDAMGAVIETAVQSGYLTEGKTVSVDGKEVSKKVPDLWWYRKKVSNGISNR